MIQFLYQGSDGNTEPRICRRSQTRGFEFGKLDFSRCNRFKSHQQPVFHCGSGQPFRHQRTPPLLLPFWIFGDFSSRLVLIKEHCSCPNSRQVQNRMHALGSGSAKPHSHVNNLKINKCFYFAVFLLSFLCSNFAMLLTYSHEFLFCCVLTFFAVFFLTLLCSYQYSDKFLLCCFLTQFAAFLHLLVCVHAYSAVFSLA